MQLTTPETYSKNDEFFIPNAVTGNVGEAVNDGLKSAIYWYERELLLHVLGEEQYRYFLNVAPRLAYDYLGFTYIKGFGNRLTFGAGSIVDDEREFQGMSSHGKCSWQNTTDSWTKLLFGDGAFFRGLEYMAACYVYYNWITKEAVYHSPVGGGKGESLGLSQASMRGKQIRSFNEIVRQYDLLVDFLRENKCLDEQYCLQRRIGPHKIQRKNRFFQ